MNELVLETQDLTVRFGEAVVLDRITLRARAGEAVALTGPSGSGKSVLLHALGGLVPLEYGQILCNGSAIGASNSVLRDRIGLILQTHGLASGLTAEENVALPLQVRGLGREEIAGRCADALEGVHLTAVATRLVDDLSGGQRQRVAVARALAGRPTVVLADEPTAELDPVNRERVLGLLLRPVHPCVVVIASNDPEIVDACPQVLHLVDGRIRAPSS